MAWQMIAAAGASAGKSYLGSRAAVRTGAVDTYNRYSAHLAKALRNNQIMDAAHKNIAAIRQDQVTNNRLIEERQQQAESASKVSAAAAGVEGGSVQDVEYMTEASAGLAIAAVEQETDNEIEAEQATIFGAAYDSAIPFQKPKRQNNLPALMMGAGIAAFSAADTSGGSSAPQQSMQRAIPQYLRRPTNTVRSALSGNFMTSKWTIGG